MKVRDFSKYLGIFILGVLLIAVYKTFDNIEYIFAYIKKIFSILVPLFIAFGISVLAFPPCVYVEKLYKKCKWDFIRKKRRALSVISVYLVFIIIIALIFSFLIPVLVKNLYSFAIQLPDFIANISEFINSFDFINVDIMGNIDFSNILNNIDFENINKYATSVMDFSSVFINIFMGIVISIYLLIDRTSLKNITKTTLNKIFKEKTYESITKYSKMLSEYVYKYLYCLVLDAGVIFVLSFIIMSILKIKYSLILSIFIGVFNVIPYFGAFIAVLVSCVITIFTSSFSKALILAVALIIMQQVDANIIQPKIVRNSFSIKPFWVILSVLIGGRLFGVLGIILAVPIAGLIKYIANEHFYLEAQNND